MFKKYKKQLLQSSIMLIIQTTILSVIITILEFISPLLIKNFIDKYKVKTSISLSLVIIATSYLVNFLFKLIANQITTSYSVKFKTREIKKLLEYMFHIEYSKLIKLEPTYLVERINNSINNLFTLFSNSISTYIISSISILFCLLLCLSIDKIITALLLVIIPIQFLGYKTLNKKLSNLSMNLQTVCAKNFANIISVTREVDYIKQSKNPAAITKLLSSNIENIYSANAKVERFAKAVSLLLTNIITLLNSGIYIYITVRMLENEITLSNFIFINLVISIFFPALNNIVNANINLRDLKGVYYFVENEIIENLENDGDRSLEHVHTISFDVKNVSYDDNVLIDSGSFTAKPGDIIMIKGKSGSGKSTLMKGLVKFLSINKIEINGIPIHEYKNYDVHNKVALFSQNIPIISGTIKDNILLGDDNRMNRFSLLEDKDYFKKFLKTGLDTMILENGSNLSGGDKQKIALSRAFLDSPEVIILDEITNSIDKESTAEIINDIIDLYKDKIIFFISHDDYIQQYCNKMVVLEDKQLKEVDLNEASS